MVLICMYVGNLEQWLSIGKTNQMQILCVKIFGWYITVFYCNCEIAELNAIMLPHTNAGK